LLGHSDIVQIRPSAGLIERPLAGPDGLTTIVLEFWKDPATNSFIFPNTAPEQFCSSVMVHPMEFFVSFWNGRSNPTSYNTSRYFVMRAFHF
jgi:hypothetical protein